jgi:hypothetical protein
MKNLVLAGLITLSTAAQAYEGSNNPDWFGKHYNHNMNSLALEGTLDDDMTPWASSFWPHIYGGIAFRWNNFYQDIPVVRQLQAQVGSLKEEIVSLKGELFSTVNPSPMMIQDTESRIIDAKIEIQNLLSKKGAEHDRYFFNVVRPETLADVRAMDQSDIDRLSPTEKFDIYVSLKEGKESNFRLTKNVLGLTGPYSQYWEGICNGWSSAAIEFEEPKVTTIKKNGITLNFGSSDLKALLSHYHFAITSNVFARKKTITNRIGERCGVEFPKEAWSLINGKEYYKSVERGQVVTKALPDECVDTNPGAFHIAMANRINGDRESFVAEVVRDMEVWNQPVIGYSSEVIETITTGFLNADRNTAKQIKVKTRLNYANDGGRMFWEQSDPEEEFYAWWNPTNGTSNYRAGHKDFEYILNLDRRGNITGGYWLSYERPDFIWLKRTKGFVGTGFGFGIVSYMNDLQDLVQIR